MTISIWRYSHLALAISSFVFILIASVTGVILAFEPISNQLKNYDIENAKEQTLAQTISVLQESYDEVLTIEIDNNDFVSASVITKDGESEIFYIDPLTGKKTGSIIEKSSIFKFATSLHRSLFLKSTGRFFVGLVSFILLLIATTGILLIIKRQQGIKRFFSKIVKENFEQYYHIVIGRFTLIPIIIITITGVYLSLEKFSMLPSYKISHQVNFEEIKETPKLEIINFPIFNTIPLENVRSVEFPFSNDVEDYFHIKLSNKELIVNQFTGEVLSEVKYPFVALASHWSLILHTGQGSILWSVILLIATCSIFFFIYSGFLMTIKRRKKSKIFKNIYKKDECEYVILVGSETGSTFGFATLFCKALLDINKTAFISELNSYTSYEKAKHLIVFAATYGEGDPPTNAMKFEQVFNKIQPNQEVQFSVLGFGSLAYTHFCKYAIDIDKMLQSNSSFKRIIELHKINGQSFESFKNWTSKWSGSTGLSIDIKQPKIKRDTKNSRKISVVNRTALNIDSTFLLRLHPKKKIQFQSGDLLAFYPEEDNVERLYSIGKIDGDIVLSIKKHELGICSTYFSKLNSNDIIKASIKRNSDFNFPTHAKKIIMIANGTGIAPFLGMINENKKNIKIHLFWGGRTKSSFEIYKNTLEAYLENKKLSSLNIAYSQEQAEKIYVQDIISKQAKLIAQTLGENGVIMICGSVAMQKQVLKTLDVITKKRLNISLEEFKNKEQIKMDCY